MQIANQFFDADEYSWESRFEDCRGMAREFRKHSDRKQEECWSAKIIILFIK